MSQDSHSEYVVPMLTGSTADLRLDAITGVSNSRSGIFLPAMRSAHHGYNSPGRLAPPAARGLQAWINGTEELRLRLAEFGWVVPDVAALDAAGFVLSPDGRTAIAMVSGDEATGSPGYLPQVRYPRGEVAAECVQGNLFTGYRESDEPVVLYFLLHRIAQAEWAAELSRPTEISKTGRITAWRPRVQIVENTPGSPPPAKAQPDSAVPTVLPTPTVRWRESA